MNNSRQTLQIVAHRGAMDEAPENTASAFEAALSHPIDGIEFDVQMTEDGKLVLYHDDNLKRITGESRPISDYEYEVTGTPCEPVVTDRHPLTSSAESSAL